MAPVKRVRWDCPNGLHAGVLGPSRPRKNATVRFCLACSEQEGVLVERVSPAMQRARAARSATAERRRESKQQREREARARAFVVVTRDGVELNVRAEMGRFMRESETLRAEARENYAEGARFRPELTLRRSPTKAHVSGHCDGWSGDITLTVGAGADVHEVREVALHELAHAVTLPALPNSGRRRRDGRRSSGKAWHGPHFRFVLCRAARELFETSVHPDDHREAYGLDRLILAQMRGDSGPLVTVEEAGG